MTITAEAWGFRVIRVKQTKLPAHSSERGLV